MSCLRRGGALGRGASTGMALLLVPRTSSGVRPIGDDEVPAPGESRHSRPYAQKIGRPVRPGSGGRRTARRVGGPETGGGHARPAVPTVARRGRRLPRRVSGRMHRNRAGAERGRTRTGPPAAAVPVPSVRVLQLNLCNSGIAGCYTGRSTAAAAAAIRAQVPDVVTLNEVCDDDMPALERALAGAVPGGAAVSTFQPVRNGRTGEPYRCRNGRQYGI